MQVSATRETVKGHGLTVGDKVNFHGTAKDGFPAMDPTLCVLGKDGNRYTLTTVTDMDPTGKPWVWTFGAAAAIWVSPVESVEITEHDVNGVTVYSGKCAHGWETGFYADRDDAVIVAAGHGEVSRPLYVAPKVAQEAAMPDTCVCDEIVDAGPDSLPVEGRTCPGCGAHFTRRDLADSPQMDVFAEAMAEAERNESESVDPIALAKQAARAHWANAHSDDPNLSADMPDSPYRRSREALLAAIEVAWPDMVGWQVYDLMVSGDGADGLLDSVSYLVTERRNAVMIVTEYVNLMRQGVGIDPADVEEARGDALGRVYDMLGVYDWTLAKRALMGMVACIYPVLDAVRLHESVTESVRMAWDAYRAPQETPAPVRTPEVGDTVYRDSDGRQGEITSVQGDSVKIRFVNGTHWGHTLADVIGDGFEIIPAAEVAEGMAAAVAPVQRVLATVTLEISKTPQVKSPIRTNLNKRKRRAAKRHAFAGKR